MLRDMNATATVAVKDINVADDFYRNKLGLAPVGDNKDPEVRLFKSGNTTIEVYKSDFAGTNKATTLTWGVGDDIENEVKNLTSKGIEFEHYNMPEMHVEGDIHVMNNGQMKVAWFKDPDGNILCLHDH